MHARKLFGVKKKNSIAHVITHDIFIGSRF